MTTVVEYLLNKTSEAAISDHLSRCDVDFIPPLSHRVKIDDYARKIASKATRFEAWSGSNLIGLVAAYFNNQEKYAYITNVSVLRKWTRKAIAYKLMTQCFEHAITLDIQQIVLQVAVNNTPAIKLYEALGFVAKNVNSTYVRMGLNLKISNYKHEQQT